jgi:hypothetical protein
LQKTFDVLNLPKEDILVDNPKGIYFGFTYPESKKILKSKSKKTSDGELNFSFNINDYEYTFDSSAFGYFMKLVNFTKQQLALKNLSLIKKDFISALLPQVSTIASKRSIAFKKFGAKRKLLLVNRYKNYSETNNVLHEKILVRVFVGRGLRRFAYRVPTLLNVREDSLSVQPNISR